MHWKYEDKAKEGISAWIIPFSLHLLGDVWTDCTKPSRIKRISVLGEGTEIQDSPAALYRPQIKQQLKHSEKILSMNFFFFFFQEWFFSSLKIGLVASPQVKSPQSQVSVHIFLLLTCGHRQGFQVATDSTRSSAPWDWAFQAAAFASARGCLVPLPGSSLESSTWIQQRVQNSSMRQLVHVKVFKCTEQSRPGTVAAMGWYWSSRCHLRAAEPC